MLIAKIIFLGLLMGVALAFTLRFVVQLFFVTFGKNEKAVYVPSFNRDISLMENLDLPPGKTLIDLGCGDGKALRFFARRYGLHGTGYDFNLQAIRYGRVINFLSKQSVRLIHSDFLSADISETDYLYLYLFPQQMLDIEDRVFASLKKDAVVIANTFRFGKHVPFQVIKTRKGKERIFLYRK